MIRFEDIKKTYSGKSGCQCGCRGKYAVASHYGIEQANADAGYKAYDAPSDRSVKSTIAKINNAIDWDDPAAVAKHVGSKWVWVNVQTGPNTERSYVAYFVKPGHGKQVRLEAAGQAAVKASENVIKAWADVVKASV